MSEAERKQFLVRFARRQARMAGWARKMSAMFDSANMTWYADMARKCAAEWRRAIAEVRAQ